MVAELYNAIPVEKMKHFIRLLYYENSHYFTHDMSFRRRAQLYRHGLLSRANTIYDLDERHPSEYVSDYDRHLRAYELNEDFDPLFTNKLVTHHMFHDFDSNLPTVFDVLDDGWFYPEDNSGDEKYTRDALKTLLKAYGKIVIKGILAVLEEKC